MSAAPPGPGAHGPLKTTGGIGILLDTVHIIKLSFTDVYVHVSIDAYSYVYTYAYVY